MIEVENIIGEFGNCTPATKDMFYIPVSSVGVIILNTLALRDKVVLLEAQLENTRQPQNQRRENKGD